MITLIIALLLNLGLISNAEEYQTLDESQQVELQESAGIINEDLDNF